MLFVCAACRRTWREASSRQWLRDGLRGKVFLRSRYSTAPARPPRIGIIGSGPAGFYSAHRLQQRLPETKIDMYEMLPTPYGLVRFGVAPDHPEVKNCIDTFAKVAEHPNFTYAGNVSIGEGSTSLPLLMLADHYDALLFAYGASKDKELGIPGESLDGVVSARAFVGWYNGLPEYANLNPDLANARETIIIGQGNVALDVARMLLSPIERIRQMPDVTEEAIDVFSRKDVRRVKIVGRRGPLQAAFTTKELRELMNLEGARFDDAQQQGMLRSLIPEDIKKLPRPLRRSAEVMLKGSKATTGGDETSTWSLDFLLSPTSFVGTNRVEAVTLQPTQFTESLMDMDVSDVDAVRGMRVETDRTKSEISFQASTVFRSVGYKSEALDGMDKIGITFDNRLGIIPNDRSGRVLDPSKGPGELTAGCLPGLYTAGWVKRGPTGVIATTMDDAFISADAILQDWSNGVPFLGGSPGSSDRRGFEAVEREIKGRNVRPVSWDDWKRIDGEEKRQGKLRGKEREKFRSVDDMLKVLE